MGDFIKNRKKILFKIGVVLLVLLVVEISLFLALKIVHRRLALPANLSTEYPFHPVLGHVLNKNQKSGCDFSATDAQGFVHNGNENRLIMPNSFKVFILGGSAVLGMGAS